MTRPSSSPQPSVRASACRGWASVVLETATIRVELVPALGAKLVSLRHRPTGKEWLVDAGSRELLPQAYGASFGHADMSGWDECFPTINPCEVDAVAGGGANADADADDGGSVKLPDHGEVWPLPWDCRIDGAAVVCSVRGVALPYELTRTLVFAADDTLRLTYAVRNCGAEPLPFLWVPHPQFAVTEPTRIVLPASARELLCVFGGLAGREGELRPLAELALVGTEQNGDGRKYYVPGRLAEGWCGLACETSGDWLRMAVDPSLVPYFGVWIDEGMENDRNAIALEPSIGYYDALDRAVANGSAGIAPPGGTFEWSLDVRLGSGGGGPAGVPAAESAAPTAGDGQRG